MTVSRLLIFNSYLWYDFEISEKLNQIKILEIDKKIYNIG